MLVDEEVDTDGEDHDELSPEMAKRLGMSLLKTLLQAAQRGDEENVELSAARAPVGYTHEKPLTIQGHQYIGGQYIPGHVMDKATPQEKAAVAGQAQASPAKTQPAQTVQKPVKSPFWADAGGDVVKPHNSLNVPRNQMPQIVSKHLPEFMEGLKAKGIKVETQRVFAKSLKPIQGELSKSQMQTLAEKLPPDKLSAPVIVSADGYLLDGHHRWGALLSKNTDAAISAHVVGLPMAKLLEEARNFSKVGYKDIASKGAALPTLKSLPPIRIPQEGEDLHAWMKEVMAHPYIAEAEKRIQGGQQEDTQKKYQRPDGSWDDNRVKKVHEPIIEHFLNPKAVPAHGQRPKAVFLIGPFGAGKSTGGTPLVNKIMANYTTVNPDDIKQKMPEDQGWNATPLHEESSYLSKEIAKRAISAGHNVLYDGSGQNTAKMMKQADELSKTHDVHVVHVTVPKHISVYRAASRFLENPFGMADQNAKPSRYAPLEYVFNDVDSKPDETYKQLRNNPNVKSGASVSTHGVKLGEQPKLLDHFTREYHEYPEDVAKVHKAAKLAHHIAGDWQEKLKHLGVKVVMGGSLVSGLALPSDENDMDVRFLYDGDREKMIPEIEKATGLKMRKTIKIGGGELGPEHDAHMIEGKLEKDGVKFEVEGQLRDTNYVGWAKYYPEVMSADELKAARAKKMELRHDKKAYKEYKNSLMEEVKRRLKIRGGGKLPGPRNQ